MGVAGLTDIGKMRIQNQDAFAIAQNDEATFVVVCDGIGGHQAGDVASKTACETMVQYFKNHYDSNTEKWFTNAIRKANTTVWEMSQENQEYRGMGTTLVAAMVYPDITYVFNVGDSRAYMLTQEEELVQVTEDHSWVNDLIKREGLDAEKAKVIGQHVITRAIGIWPSVEGDIYEIEGNYKALMLCSDGLGTIALEQTIRFVA